MHYVSPHYSLLVKFDQDRYPEVKGDLAESWNVSSDGLVYTFKLRPNVLFHDGTPLTSADVKATFDRLLAPPPGVVSASQALFDAVKSVEAPDAATRLDRLAEGVCRLLAHHRLSPHSADYGHARKSRPIAWTNTCATIIGKYWKFSI